MEKITFNTPVLRVEGIPAGGKDAVKLGECDA